MKKSVAVLAFAFITTVFIAFQNCATRKGYFFPSSDTLSSQGDSPFGLKSRVVPTGINFPDGSLTSVTITSQRAFPNLTFSSPVFLTYAPDGQDRIFVLEKGGKIIVFNNADTATVKNLFLDITSIISADPNTEEGLLGLAFDPNYATNRFFYIYYSAASPRRSVVARFTDSGTNAEKLNSKSIILEVIQPPALSNHKAGMIAFKPGEPFLYIALGDGGGGGDPFKNGQNKTQLLGKILRIDPRTSPYVIPAGNPFGTSANPTCATSVGSVVCQEIFAFGLRNPFRFSFDRVTGKLWVGDVGQGNIEEIDIVNSGGNYGWGIMEGNNRYDTSLPIPADHSPPLFTYDHSVGQSITGGYVYRGSNIPSLVGWYVYGDFVQGKYWKLFESTKQNDAVNISVANPTSFGEDKNGELYITSYGGTIHRIVASGTITEPVPPNTLSQTGLFQDLASLTPVSGIIEYAVNMPLWSDGSRKRRWMALPNSKIQFSPTSNWIFPPKTVFIKHFEFERAPGQVQRLETRVFVLQSVGWRGYTYIWNSAGTEATLQASGVRGTTSVNSAAGTFTWTFPSRSDCFSCHTSPEGTILGPRTRQLNGNFTYPNGVTDNQLRSWDHVDLFATKIGAPELLEKYSSETLPKAARGYLAVNCAMCHQPGVLSLMDLRFDTPLAMTSTVNVPPNSEIGTARIQPGNKDESSIWLRMGHRGDGFQMPPLGSSVVDGEARKLIGDWITQGPN